MKIINDTKGNDGYCEQAVHRALELISLTIDAQRGKHCLGEFTRLYEVVGHCYFGDNQFNPDGASLQKYSDQFAYACGRGVKK